MRISAAALVLLCACAGSTPPPAPPSNQTAADEGTSAPAATPARPPDIAVEIVAAAGLAPGTGTATGTLADITGAYVIGATVVATSPVLTGSQVAISDENGRFEISALPAGRYTITVYYADLTFEHPAEVAAGKITQLRVTNWNTAAPEGEVILLEGTP